MNSTEYHDGCVYRRRLSPEVGVREASQIEADEIAMLRAWATTQRIDILLSYARWLHQRVWDEHVNVVAIDDECRRLLAQLEKAA